MEYTLGQFRAFLVSINVGWNRKLSDMMWVGYAATRGDVSSLAPTAKTLRGS